MAPADTVLVIHSDGTASLVDWPDTDDARRAVIAVEVGATTRMRRCGKGILGFLRDEAPADPDADAAPADDINTFAAAAYAEQGVEMTGDLRGPVLFARNPSKGSVIKPLTAAQTANLLVVTGARIV